MWNRAPVRGGRNRAAASGWRGARAVSPKRKDGVVAGVLGVWGVIATSGMARFGRRFRAASEQPVGAEREGGGRRDDDVVVQCDADRLEGGRDAVGRVAVLP